MNKRIIVVTTKKDSKAQTTHCHAATCVAVIIKDLDICISFNGLSVFRSLSQDLKTDNCRRNGDIKRIADSTHWDADFRI